MREPHEGPLVALAERPLDCDHEAVFRGSFVGTSLAGALSLSATPVLMSPDYVDRLRTLTPRLETAIRSVVAAYFDDPRIRKIYDLAPELERILRLAQGQPYSVGFYRPDFVFDRDGQPRICEIGARFPLNGWMLSHRAATGLAESFRQASLRAQPELNALFSGMVSSYPRGGTVAMVHAGEAGTELFCLRTELLAQGLKFIQAHPSKLETRGDDIVLQGRRIDRLILEMDRTELPLFREEVLARMIERGEYFNDVRTLILVHDKRILAVLSEPSIMGDYLEEAEYLRLRRFLIPTRVVNDDADVEAMLNRSENWIAKPSSGGRGVGTYLREVCGPDEWEDLVRNRWRDYVFQEYLDQCEFRDPDSGKSMHLIGMHLCHDRESHGPGIFRGSDERVINVHQGRGRLFAGAIAS